MPDVRKNEELFFVISQAALPALCGWLYLIASVCFIVAGSIRSRIIEPDRISATADNIRASAGLFRIGLVIDLVSIVVFLLTAIALYQLLVHVDQVLAAAMVIFVMVGVPIALLAVIHEYSALMAATRADYITAVGPAVADSFVMLQAEMQTSARVVHELIAGLWLLPLGYLVFASGSFPKVLGVLLVIGGLSWLAHLSIAMLAPQLARLGAYVVLGAIGEVIFIGWLILRGATVSLAD
jgi:hypothetical protein